MCSQSGQQFSSRHKMLSIKNPEAKGLPVFLRRCAVRRIKTSIQLHVGHAVPLTEQLHRGVMHKNKHAPRIIMWR